MYKKAGKRLLDVLVAGAIFLATFPILLLIIAGLFMITTENPLFIQKRPGKHQALFNLYKIKTMYSQRSMLLTKFCLLLRKYSIDELPQFINVLRGDMSIIGPRPLLPEYLPLYNSTQLRRHEVRPGITGWAQINGRNGLPWPIRFTLDIWYVEHLSFSVDMKILWLTCLHLFSPKNVKEHGLSVYEKFTGNALESPPMLAGQNTSQEV